MPPPLRKSHPRKKAIARQKDAFRHISGFESSDENEGQDGKTPLWKQICALERSEAALAASNASLAAADLRKSDQIAQLFRDKEQQARESTRSMEKMRQSGARVLGGYQRALCESRDLRAALAGAGDQRRAAEQLHQEQQAADARETKRLREQLDDATRDAARWKKELSGAQLEAKIYRCAMLALHQTLESEAERRWVLRALDISRANFTNPTAEPALPSPTASDACEQQHRKEGETEGDLPQHTPSRCQLEPLTPVSMGRVTIMSMSDKSENTFITPRRDGLRPRKHHVDQNGSPW
ncbi:hypothetical protein PWT90_06281 [Aphanocladium album]|nr:hypothetical protein PWT90_06281 [Aphanocladium album]